MEELSLKLENCYGIKNLNKKLEFSNEKNVYSIYAPNGVMKTSLLKTFKSLEKGEEPIDEIYNNIDGPLKRETSYQILVDGININQNQIFTIQSMSSSYKSENLKDLLINEDLKIKLDSVFKKRSDFLNYLNNKSGKIGLDIIENILKKICGKEKSSFLYILEDIELKLGNYSEDYSNIEYKDIFSLEDKLKSTDFQNNIDDFIIKSDEIYSGETGSKIFSKEGNFGLFRLKKIFLSLESENFYFDDNKLIINGNTFSKNELNDIIKNIETQITGIKEFKKINSILSNVGGNKLKELIENSLIPIEKLNNNNRENFYNEIIISYIKKEIDKFGDLISSFKLIQDEIKKSIDSDEGNLWKKVVYEFNQRFHVPFKMEIDNIKSVILGENTPKIIFYFCDKFNKEDCGESDWIPINSEENLKLVLSQGEKRALYLLNVLFEIENKIRLIYKGYLGQQLLIIDDIADSFDYKNKYAIIQYLKDLAEKINTLTGEKYFNLIILTHNFDFYRTIQSRLGIYNEKNIYALKNEIGINLINGYEYVYAINDIIDGGQDCIYKYLSLIPVARNLVEYIIGKDETDYLSLTAMLHSNGEKYTKGFLNSIFNAFLRYNLDEDEIGDIHELIIKKCDEINDDILTLDKKVVLSIGIRYEAEKYMNNKLLITPGITKQIGKLYSDFKEKFTTDVNLKILSDVVLMTPENIHLNSFMYEPILDMSDWHLKELFKKVKILNETTSN